MRIVCIGGGPAGLYFGLLMKKENPAHHVTVIERNKPYDTFGWGVVFSDATMENMRAWDPRDAQPRSRTRSIIGTTSRSDQGPAHAHHRPRLYRHRPQETAQHSAGALRSSSAWSSCSSARSIPTSNFPTPT